MSQIPGFATIDPFNGMTPDNPGVARSLVAGSWLDSNDFLPDVPDPMSGGGFLKIPDTTDIEPFINSLKTCPKSGMHNPQKNPQRYVELGQVCARAAAMLAEPEISDYFTKLIQRVMPKSWKQCKGEVTVTRVFLENFAGDGVRFLARGFSNPGDYPGQESRGYRWPFQVGYHRMCGYRTVHSPVDPCRPVTLGCGFDPLPWLCHGEIDGAGTECSAIGAVHRFLRNRGTDFRNHEWRRQARRRRL